MTVTLEIFHDFNGAISTKELQLQNISMILSTFETSQFAKAEMSSNNSQSLNTRSIEETFETYSSLFADMYIHEIIGSNKNNFANSGNSPKKDDKHIEGLNEHTIEGYHQLCE